MMNFSLSYARDSEQNDTIPPMINLVVMNGDTLFTMNRTMVEEITIQYDSLVNTTKKLNDCMEVVDSFLLIQEKYQIAIKQSSEISDMLKKENSSKDKVISSYENIDKIQKDIIGDMSKEFRKARNRNRLLTGLTIGGITFGFTSFMLLLLK
jgi:hypothetical protein